MKKNTVLILVALFFLVAGCYKQKDFDQVNIDPNTVILNLSLLKDSLLANSADTTTISAELPLGAKDSTVTFTASSGLFVETGKNTATIKSLIRRVGGVQKRQALVTYQTGLAPAPVKLTAQVNDYVRNLDMTVLGNLATGLKITPSAPSLKADPLAEMTFTVNLSGKGTVSPGQLVKLTVQDPGKNNRGSFRLKKELSDATGSCTFIYNIMPDTAYRGKLTVIGLAVAGNKTLTDTIPVYIIK